MSSARRQRQPQPRRRHRRSRSPEASLFVGGLAAAGYLALALADGGFGTGTWAAATLLVWWAAIVAIVSGAWPSSSLPRAAAIAGGTLLGLAVLAAASIGWSQDPGAAYADAIRAAGYLGLFALAAVAMRAGAARPLFAGLALGLFALAAVALLSRLEPGFAGGTDEALALRVSGGRLSYPLGYWNALGACMAAGVVLLTWLGASAAAPGTRALAAAAIPVPLLTLFLSGSRGAALAAGAGLAVLFAAGPRRVTLASVAALGLGGGLPLIVFAASSTPLVDGREGAAAAQAGDQLLFLVIAAFVLLAVAAAKADRWIAAAHLPVLGLRRVVVGAVIVGALGLLVSDPVSRLRSFDAPPESIELTKRQEVTRFANVGGSGRGEFWRTALEAAVDQPLRGIGAGGFEAYWNRNGSLELSVEHAHSLFLESAAELGVLGLALALAFFAVPALEGVRRLRAPLAWADPDSAGGATGAALAVLAAGFVAAGVDWVWDMPAAFVPAVIAASFLVSPAPRPQEDSKPAGPRRPWWAGPAIAAGVVVLGLACCMAAGALFLSEQHLQSSRAATAAGDPERAAEEAQRAIDLAPYAAEPRLRLAEAERARGRYGDARRAINAAQERAEGDWRLWLVEAGIELESGRFGPGVYALNRARELNPKAPAKLFVYPTSLSIGEPAAD